MAVRVVAGPFDTEAQARAAAADLRKGSPRVKFKIATAPHRRGYFVVRSA
jgi:hypothetical protein